MASAARTVRSLRLRAPSEAAVRRTAIVLEDALRTASLPDAGGRLLFVRRLALGRIDVDASPASMAVALEHALAYARPEWRHGGEPGGFAGAVWFRDALDAHVALALRLLTGPPPTEWYWPRAVPGWRPAADRARALRHIAGSLAARPEAPAALPQWFATLVRAGQARALSATLRVEDLPALARAAGIVFETGVRSPATCPPRAPGNKPAPAAAAGSGRRRETPASTSPHERAVRRFLAAMLRAAGAAPAAEEFSAFMDAPRREQAPPANASPVGPPASDGGTPNAPAAAVAKPDSGASVQGASIVDGAAEPSLLAERPALDGLVAPDLPWPGQAVANTSAGGLLFLLHGLSRIGYAGWLEAQPVWARRDVARRVLARVLARLRVGDDDAAWTLVEVPPPTAPEPRRFVAPACWRAGLLSGTGPFALGLGGDRGRLRDSSGRLLLGAWLGPRPRPLLGDCRRARLVPAEPGTLEEEVVEAWLVALRRWVRRYARVGLADVVLRPGHVSATPTHVDVEFDLGAADLRIRRAGLDVNVGWVPWFGRVVAFHYEPARQP